MTKVMFKYLIIMGVSLASAQAFADATLDDVVRAVDTSGQNTVNAIDTTSDEQIQNADKVGGQIIDTINDAFLDYKVHWTEYYTRSLNEQRDYQNQLRFTLPPFNKDTIVNGTILKEVRDKRDFAINFMEGILTDWNGYSLFNENANPYTKNENYIYLRFSKICSVKDRNAGWCEPQKGTLTPDEPEDVLAYSILGKSMLNEDDVKLAHMYMQNVTNPMPVEMPNVDELFQDKDTFRFSKKGLDSMEVWIRNMSLMSLAQASFVDSMAKRIPVEITDPENSEKTYYESEYSILDKETNRRLGNPEWVKEINQTASTEALLRELISISAAQLSLMNELRKDIEHIKLNVAAQTAELARKVEQETGN